jgi:hypothetical protein
MNDEGSESDRYSNDTMASILEEALKPYAEEERLIFETQSRKWVSETERMLASRNEKDAVAAFRDFLATDGGLERMRQNFVRFSSRHKTKWSRPKDLQLLQEELRAVFTMISSIKQRAIAPLLEHCGLGSMATDLVGNMPFGPSVYTDIHHAALEAEQALLSMEEFTSMVMQAAGPDRGGRASPAAKDHQAPIEWLARALAFDWQESGRNLRKHDGAVFLQILRAMNEVITYDEDLPRGGKDLLANARKVTKDQEPRQ